MSKDFSYLRHWITGEDYPPGTPLRPVILECIRSRSGMSMTVYDRGRRLYSINGYGFDRIGTALAKFLETCFQPELRNLNLKIRSGDASKPYGFYGASLFSDKESVELDGACGVEAMIEVADAIGLKVQQSESKAGILIIISKKGA